MPRYYFDVTNAGNSTRDQFGIDLAGDTAARDEAIAVLPAIAREELSEGDQHEFVVEVRNEAGQIVYEASLALNGRWWPGRR